MFLINDLTVLFSKANVQTFGVAGFFTRMTGNQRQHSAFLFPSWARNFHQSVALHQIIP
jgi:hypothetical protein